MARFRSYKDYDSNSDGNFNNYWTTDSNYSFDNKIPTKSIFRALGDIIKYGKAKKEVLR